MLKKLFMLFTLLPAMAFASNPHIEFYDNGQPCYEFTNFFGAPFEESGTGYHNTWATSENYFQARKFNYPGARHVLDEIKNAKSPREAFNIVRQPENAKLVNQNWHGDNTRNAMKCNAMFDALNRKFEAHPALKALLIATDGLNIFECSPKDRYWGTGANNAYGPGDNMLGKLLVELRENYLGTANSVAFKSYPVWNNPFDITDVTKDHLRRIGRWDYYQHISANPHNILSYQAFMQMKEAKPLLSVLYRLGQSGEGLEFPHAFKGFSGAELTHRWTDGDKATFILPICEGSRRLTSVTFKDTRGLVTAAHQQLVSVFLGEQKVGEYKYDVTQALHTIPVAIPVEAIDNAEISFGIPNAATPLELGINGDPRKLGILMNMIEMTYIDTK